MAVLARASKERDADSLATERPKLRPCLGANCAPHLIRSTRGNRLCPRALHLIEQSDPLYAMAGDGLHTRSYTGLHADVSGD